MDVDLDERNGLACCARCANNTETLQFHQSDHAGLRGFEPAKEIVNRYGVYCWLRMIFDGYLIIERYCGESRCISNAIDPFIACDCRDPRSEGP